MIKSPPRDVAEITLSQIWQEVLGRPVTDIDQHLFLDLGGTSLGAVQLIVEIGRALGVELRIADLLSAPTIREMTNLIIDRVGADFLSPLVPIRQGTDATPLYLIHPVSGTLTKFFELARALDPAFTLVGIQSLGLEQGTAPLSSIEEMAAVYVDQIRADRPGGRWRMLGYSMGGYIACEMARLLFNQGEDVEFVGILDSHLPRAKADFDFEATRTRVLHELAERMLGLKLDWDSFSSLTRDRQAEEITARASVAGALSNVSQAERFFRFVDVRVNNHRAMSKYDPAAFPSKLTLFKSEQPLAWDVPAAATARDDDGLNGWRSLGPRIEVVRIPGDHFSMMAAPNTLDLAKAVQDRVASSSRQSRAPQ